MQLGFVTAIVPDLSFEQVVDFASATGYACIEMMCWPKGKAERRYAGITHIDCAALTASEAERLVDYTADRKVGISGLGYYPNALSPVPEEAQVAVEQIHRVIDAAEMMGVGVMNTFIGRDWKLSVERQLAADGGNVETDSGARQVRRRENRDRELSDAVHAGRVAGRKEPHDDARYLAADVQ